MEECDAINAENCILKDVYSELKRMLEMLKKDKQEFEHANEILKCEKLKVEEKTLALCENLDMLKESMNMREKVFNTNLTRLESESLHLKLRIKSLICENNQLLEKLHKVESDLSENKR